MKFGVALLAAISMLGAGASVAGAADSIFWANYNAPTGIAVANLDGTGSGRDLFTASAPRGGSSGGAGGLVLDPASGWLYWANATGGRIVRGSIDSCDAAAFCASNLYPLVSGGPTVTGPGGPAIDSANGLMYWMNGDGTLVRASLDGTGSVNNLVSTTGATALGGGGAGALAIDPRTNRIYWTNDDFGAGKISWANLDGTGGGDVNTTGANMGRPWGLALDTAANKVYWASFEGSVGGKGTISWANLDGTGGGDLYTATTCGVLNGPNGVAIDHAANMIYWANFGGNTISSAFLDGSGGCSNTSTVGATLAGPDEVTILKAPVAAGAPAISGGKTGKATCSTGTWGGDSPEAFFFRSPRTFTYQWKKSGAVVSGASSATFTPTSSGSYTCAATATNAAGSTAGAESAAAAVKRLVKFATPKLKRETGGAKISLTGKISFSSKPAVSRKDCSGTVALKVTKGKKKIAGKSFKLKYKSRKCTAAASLKVAKKYAGSKAKLTLSIGKSSKLTAAKKTVSLKL